MIWLTADQHHNHANILHFCKRPFENIRVMDETFIYNWNILVSPDDTIYQQGDFVLGGPDEADGYFRRLYGKIRVIPGGHDYRWLRRKKPFYSLSGHAVQVLPPLYNLKTRLNNKKVFAVLCHYSMRTWDRSHYGSVHFFGHSHNRLEGHGRSCDVGVDAWNYKPVSLEAAIAFVDNKQPWEERPRRNFKRRNK